MDALRRKYSDRREEILTVVQVTNDLLALLTREGLLDIADCVRYQGMADMRKRTPAFFDMLTARRTERAYRVLIQGLRETGQDKAADLFTDVEEETNLIAQLQKVLDERVESIEEFIQNEADIAGVEYNKVRAEKLPAEKKPCGHPKKGVVVPNKRTTITKEEDKEQRNKNNEFWRKAQESMRRAADQLERCKMVIGKLHQDCHTATDSYADLSAQTKDAYLQLSRMIRPSQKHTGEIQQNPHQTTEELFHHLVDDVHCLMTRERKAQEREIEGRAKAMRTLRQLRDWMVDRAGILSSLHATFRPLGNARFKSNSYTPRALPPAMMLPLPHHSMISPDGSGSMNLPEPVTAAVVESPTLHDHYASSVAGSQKALMPAPFATSTPRPSPIPGSGEQKLLEIQPISTLVEGVDILEKQLREYIHLEILLTDKFRFEMRMKQHQHKAQGFTHQGINDAQKMLGKLSTSSVSENRDPDFIYKIKTQLDQISREYNQCGEYMDKVTNSLTQIDDAENFLRTLHDKENRYKKDMSKSEKKKHKGKTHNEEAKDSYTALVEMLKPDQRSRNSKMSKSKENIRLPSISSRKSDEISATKDTLLSKLKVLVANFEIVRLRMLTVEDRYRREFSRKERKFESILRSKEENVYRLQTLLNEAEADREKYVRLYNSTKLSTSRNK